MVSLPHTVLFVGTVLFAGTLNILSQPTEYVSNLTNRWPEGEVGDDIHGLERDPVVARFTTGNTGVYLTALTFEFLADETLTGWERVNVVLHPSSSDGTRQMQLINPSVNPKQTQWPPKPHRN